MGIEVFIIAALGALIGGLVQGLSGFAFTMVAMSVWVWKLDPLLSAVLAVCGAFFGQVVGLVSIRRQFLWPILLPFIVGGFLGMPLGFKILPYIEIVYLKAGLGILLLVWCPAMLFMDRLPRLVIRGRLLSSVMDGLVGFLGGILGVLAGLSGSLPALWCLLRGYEKDLQRAIFQYYNLSILGVTMALYIARGLITQPMLPVLGVVLLILFIPVIIGTRLYKTIDERTFRRVVLVLLTLSGIALLISAGL